MADGRCGGQDTTHALRTRLTDQDTQGTDQKTHGPRKGAMQVESMMCLFFARRVSQKNGRHIFFGMYSI